MITLYIKIHNKTKLKYFGKTTSDPNTYRGSGKYWKRHIAKHGYDVKTIILYQTTSEQEASDWALSFSVKHDIVNNSSWANLRVENGKDGAPKGNMISEEVKQKISKSLTGRNLPKSKYIFVNDTPAKRSHRIKEFLKNKIWCTNGVISGRFEECPNGWWPGRGPKHKSKGRPSFNKDGKNTKNKVIYNNGKQHKYFFVDTQPIGWVRGKMEHYYGGRKQKN